MSGPLDMAIANGFDPRDGDFVPPRCGGVGYLSPERECEGCTDCRDDDDDAPESGA
jgi:hypothetical protein